MRNFYLFELALKVGTVEALENGIVNLNEILVNRDEERDKFLCNGTIWECDTTLGKIYDLFGGVINEELRRVVPFVFSAFVCQANIYQTDAEIDADFPNDCNGFAGFDFSNTQIPNERQIINLKSYAVFITLCLKYGTVKNTIELRWNLSQLFPSFVFEDRALEETFNWRSNGGGLYDRLLDLFDDIPKNPFTGGIGETEVLKHMKGVASKRINQAHRVTYLLSGNEIRILACHGHYD